MHAQGGSYADFVDSLANGYPMKNPPKRRVTRSLKLRESAQPIS
jgi:hypothetical protein